MLLRNNSLSRQVKTTLLAVTLVSILVVGLVIITRPKAATPQQTWKILPWGDSNTEGGTPPDGFCNINPGGYSYRGNLFKKLTTDGYSIDYIGPLSLNGCTGMTEDIPDLNHAGYGAFSISDPGGGDCGSRSPGVCGYGLLENIDAMQVKDADIILLMIGFNGRGPASALEALVNATMQVNPDVKLFVGGYPNTPGDYSDMQDLRDKAKEMADRSASDGIYWVDLNRTLTDGGDFLGDGVHHSQQGAAKVSQRFYDAIIASDVLGGSTPTTTPTPTPTVTPTTTPTPSVTSTPTPTPTPTVTPTPDPTNAKYDLDDNGEIGIGDLTLLIKDYPRHNQTPIPNSPADFNSNGAVDLSDLSKLVSLWGQQVS